MAEKMKKRLSRRAQERLNRQLRSFDLAMLGILLTTLVSGVVCVFGSTALDRPDAGGFAFWYIVVQSYLPMGLLSGFRALFGSAAFDPGVHGAGFITATALVWDVLLWAVIRTLGKRNNKSPLLRVGTQFALVIFYWGCFQLLCAVFVAGWNQGGMSSLHRKLANPPAVRADGKIVKTPAPADDKH